MFMFDVLVVIMAVYSIELAFSLFFYLDNIVSKWHVVVQKQIPQKVNNIVMEYCA